MKKRLTFGFLFATLAMSLGLTSCKKECKSCATYTYDGETVTYCVGETVDSTVITQAYIDYLVKSGAAKYAKSCKK